MRTWNFDVIDIFVVRKFNRSNPVIPFVRVLKSSIEGTKEFFDFIEAVPLGIIELRSSSRIFPRITRHWVTRGKDFPNRRSDA